MRLVLLRHAKSDWSTGAVDHDRPLNARGQRDAPRMAEALHGLGWGPDLVISSDARRTQQTWQSMASQFPEAVVDYRRDLYEPSLGDVQDAIRSVPAEVRCAWLIGHNPGFENAVGWLSGSPVGLTTCNAALLEADAPSWSAAADASWVLHQVLRPKEI